MDEPQPLWSGHGRTDVGGSADADSEDVSILCREQQERWFELQFLHWSEARDYSLLI